MRPDRLTATLLSLVVAAVSLLSCGKSDPTSDTRTARELLAELVVTQASDDGSYERPLFGEGYADADNDCQDTRSELLVRDSQQTTTGRCNIETGYWQSEYESFSTSEASEITVDHLVALKEAWISGASEWPKERLERYFNDLGFEFSLSLMSKTLNGTKGSSDPSSWLPARAICEYVVRWVAVKYRWNLSVDDDEKAKIEEVLNETCGNTRVAVSLAD